MSTEEEIIDCILSLHDEEFKSLDSASYPCWFYKLGKWYWSDVFYATRDVLTDGKWTFQVSGEFIHSKELEEKFERIYQRWCDYYARKNEIVRENRLKEILSCLKPH